jgi:hypothetical protein
MNTDGQVEAMSEKRTDIQKSDLKSKGEKIPETVTEYLKDKHLTIVNNYRTPDNLWSEHCGLIAVDIAKLFLDAGKNPFIVEVAEDINENGIIRRKSLEPLIFNGRVSWGAHQVCCCDGEAFDPILEGPISIQKYTEAVFGEDINMRVIVPSDEIIEFVSR